MDELLSNKDKPEVGHWRRGQKPCGTCIEGFWARCAMPHPMCLGLLLSPSVHAGPANQTISYSLSVDT